MVIFVCISEGEDAEKRRVLKSISAQMFIPAKYLRVSGERILLNLTVYW